MNFASSQRQQHYAPLLTHGTPLKQITETVGSEGGHTIKTSYNNKSPHRQLTGVENLTSSYKSNGGMYPIPSANHLLEESVKAPDRPPQKVPGLTTFLCNEHYKRIGVFSKSEDALFKFWK